MELQNLHKRISRANGCNMSVFNNSGNSYTHFLSRIKVQQFRRLKDLEIEFEHPVTIISGTNKIGKTSLLLLMACSHENFKKIDSTKPTPTIRNHHWKDVLSFTKHENVDVDYAYEIDWRIGDKLNKGSGKRLARTRSWSGLGKKAKGRKNAKIQNREVRLIDLERLLPARSFSNSLLRKTSYTSKTPLNHEISQAYCYIFDTPVSTNFEISEAAGHVNKKCYLINDGINTYSSYNAASGEESLINLLRDVIESPQDSLILIDELEAGLHPSIQRRLAEIIQFVSWEHKKQFIITSHSPTLIEAFPAKSRKFIEFHNERYETTSGISPQAAMSKMDAIGHPLIRLFCEDDIAEFLIKKRLIELNKTSKNFDRLFQILRSGTADMVKTDLCRQKHHFDPSLKMLGYCAVIDGDYANKGGFKELSLPNENLIFLFPHKAPETFLIEAYLGENPNAELESFVKTVNKHALFQKMVDLGLASDKGDARNLCYNSFCKTADFTHHQQELDNFLHEMEKKFSSFPLE